jgi:hypothetical protein
VISLISPAGGEVAPPIDFSSGDFINDGNRTKAKEAIKASNTEHPEAGEEPEDTGEPGRRHRADGEIVRTELILLPVEGRRQRIDYEPHHVDHHNRSQIVDDGGGALHRRGTVASAPHPG